MSFLRGKTSLKVCVFAGLVAAIGATMVYTNGKGEAGAASNNETMFQGFEWTLSSDGYFWNDFSEKADELSAAGVTAVWLPPAYKGSSANDVGYSVYDLYDLGEFNQKGTVRTKYGTKDEYLSLIDTLHDNNIKVYADIVLNHKSSADATNIVSAVPVDGSDRNVDIGEAQDIEAWTAFNFEGRNNTYSSFKWNANHFDGVDWDQLTGTNAIYRFADKTWEQDVSDENGNYDYLLSADIDLNNTEVINELNTWAKWYVDTADLDGFRLDAVKHMSANFYKNWLKSIRKARGNSLYAVAENYDYNVDNLLKYIKDTSNSASVFDFPLRGKMHEASTSDGDFDMKTFFKDTLVSSKKSKLAVTFVENHDTQPSQSSHYVRQWFKGQAYTAILTRNSGTPCVFYGDYYGTNDGKSVSMADELNVLMSVRQIAAYGKQRDYLNDADVIGWTREGDYKHSYYGMAAVITDGAAGSKTMNVGKRHKNEVWVDVTGNCTETVTITSKGYGTFPVNEKSYSVWVSQAAAEEINDIIVSIGGKSIVTLPEDNTVTVFYNTTWNKAYFHHQIGSGEWTESPGAKLTNTNLSDYKVITVDLGTSRSVLGCFNNGGSSWDSNGGSNYTFRAGTYIVSNGTITSGTPDGYDPNGEIIEETPEVEKEQDASLTLIYYSTWETPHAHYSVGDGAWTGAPGVQLTATDKEGYYTITIPMCSDETATVCFNDGDSYFHRYYPSYYLHH